MQDNRNNINNETSIVEIYQTLDSALIQILNGHK